MSELFSCVLRDSTPRYVCPSVGRSVGPLFTFFCVFELFEHMAPAHPHATRVAVYPALFGSYFENPDSSQVEDPL